MRRPYSTAGATSAGSRDTPAVKRAPQATAIVDGASAYVEKVADGDTLEARAGHVRFKVRVLGIDCPESHRNAKCVRDGREGRLGCREQLPRGLKAARRAAELLKHQVVTFEGPMKRDRYGRTLSYVRLADGRDLGLTLIREGLCEDFGWKYPHPRGPEYRAAAGAQGGGR